MLVDVDAMELKKGIRAPLYVFLQSWTLLASLEVCLFKRNKENIFETVTVQAR